MESFLEFAKGPLFRLSFLVMILGLLRHLAILIFGMVQAIRKAADPVPPYSAPLSKLTMITLGWLIPVKHITNRLYYSIASMIFHIGLIVVPIFLFAHIQLWRDSIGIGWVSINQSVLDIMTLVTIAAGLLLFAGRLANSGSRQISRPQDYLLTWFLILPFISGYLAMHTNLLPFSYTLMMLIHVLSAEIVFILIPFSKISHCVLYPLAHYASNFAWRFVPDGGEKVLKSLGKEEKV